MIFIILTCLATLIYVIYNIVAICKFGVPQTLSYTYYYYNSIKPGLGYLFTAMMCSMAGLLIAPWMGLTLTISSWSHYFILLPFFACGFIAFVGLAPHFKDKKEETIHTWFAILAAALSVLWSCIVCWNVGLIVVPCCICILMLIGWITKTLKSCLIYWFETAAFISTFGTILIEEYLKL